jgi:predicted transcriptional regulator
MARTPQDVTDAELGVLQVLWYGGPAAIRRITDALYPGGAAAQYATVQKLLERLEGKGCVRRDRDTWPHTFAAVVERGELIGRQLQQTADKLCDGSLQPLLTHLVRSAKLSALDRQSLRSLLDDLTQEGKKPLKK